MTLQEFNNTRWGFGMKCTYENTECPILAVDFDDNLVLIMLRNGLTEWVEHQEITLIK